MNAMTIQCTRCDAFLVLTPELLQRVQGRTGRVPCQGCGEKIGLDGRGEELVLVGARVFETPGLELDEAPSVRGDRLSLLPTRASLPPPRPSLAPRPQLPSNPFDELGSLAPVVPLQGVRLTVDGRLVNRSDEAPSSKRSRVRTWAPLVAAALLATGFASARVGSILPLGRLAPELEPPSAVPVTQLPSSASLAPAPSEMAPAVQPAAVTPSAVPSPKPLVSGSKLAPRESAPSVEPSPDEAVSETSSRGAEAFAAEAVADDTAASDDTATETEFSKDAASVALQHAAAEAMGCRQPGDPAGRARVVLTFAPSGRVTSANISGAPYAGTLTGGCIAGHFRGATVPAFSGGYVTVSKTISLQ